MKIIKSMLLAIFMAIFAFSEDASLSPLLAVSNDGSNLKINSDTYDKAIGLSRNVLLTTTLNVEFKDIAFTKELNEWLLWCAFSKFRCDNIEIKSDIFGLLRNSSNKLKILELNNVKGDVSEFKEVDSKSLEYFSAQGWNEIKLSSISVQFPNVRSINLSKSHVAVDLSLGIYPQKLQYLTLDESEFDKNLIKYISQIRSLSRLSFNGVNAFESGDLKMLTQSKVDSLLLDNSNGFAFVDEIGDNVKLVSMSGCRIDSACIKKLALKKSLNYLIVNSCRLSDEIIGEISKMENIEQLSINDVGITREGFEKIMHMKKLTGLSIGLNGLDDNFLAEAKIDGSEITSLGLSGNKLTDNSSVFFKKFPHLTSVNVKDNKFTQAGINEIKKIVPNIAILDK